MRKQTGYGGKIRLFRGNFQLTVTFLEVDVDESRYGREENGQKWSQGQKLCTGKMPNFMSRPLLVSDSKNGRHNPLSFLCLNTCKQMFSVFIKEKLQLK